MISEDEITRIEVCPYYNFHDKYLIENFIIDLKNKKAHWKDDKKLTKTIQKGLESNDDLFYKLIKSISMDEHILDEKKIINFKNQLKKIDFIKQLHEMEDNLIKDFDFSKSDEYVKKVMISNLNDLNLIRKFFISVHTENESENHIINFDIPERWADFLLAVNNLVGLDVLGLCNENYWITPVSYLFKKDGIYYKENNEILELEKFKFKFKFVLSSNYSSFMINFIKNELTIITDEKIIEKLTPEEINAFKNCIIQNNVFLWGDKHSWSNFTYNNPSLVLDGHEWYLELEFTNGAIFHVGLYNGHPDTYFDFGEDVKELFNMDLMRLNECRF